VAAKSRRARRSSAAPTPATETAVFGERAGGWQLDAGPGGSPAVRRPVVSTSGPPGALPFGAGSRACTGRPLSYIESRTVVAELLLRFRIESAPLAEGGGEAAPQVAPDELCEPAAWPACAAFVSS
jgi:hypothetical protein